MIFPEGNSHPLSVPDTIFWLYDISIQVFVWEFAAEYVMPETLVKDSILWWWWGDNSSCYFYTIPDSA